MWSYWYCGCISGIIMSYGNWTTVSGGIQGDISYNLRKTLVTPIYALFELNSFGEKWQEFDLAFEYRENEKEEWMEDAVITETSANYLRGNKLYGLKVGKYGEINTIIWKYSDNNLIYGSVPQIRLRFLPRIRLFSNAASNYTIASLYGESLINLDGLSENNIVGINQKGQYMGIGSNVFYIMEDLGSESSESSSSYIENWSSSSSSSSSFSSP